MSGSGTVFGIAENKACRADSRQNIGSSRMPVVAEHCVRIINLLIFLPDGVTVAHGPLEARVQVQILVGQFC